MMVDETLANEEGGALGQLRWSVPFLRAHRKAPKAGSVRYAGDEWRGHEIARWLNEQRLTMPGVVKMVGKILDLWYVGVMRLLGVLHLLDEGAGWAIAVACFKTGQAYERRAMADQHSSSGFAPATSVDSDEKGAAQARGVYVAALV